MHSAFVQKKLSVTFLGETSISFARCLSGSQAFIEATLSTAGTDRHGVAYWRWHSHSNAILDAYCVLLNSRPSKTG